ncbi:hypothetical protein L211DRAFT_868542 [Terfezia boudieri ATCC MYA-4762]|uniref:Uncharacterized protein n=1 Tax=Terfezia boudieri ATCC MYA-4762 TaxID=1051890 RepID=A0A3N4LL82_9PEZI|nr:hypothetical protein L211DRAFT_868542 [Terfezia boudieri ATCC MYA-4762]
MATRARTQDNGGDNTCSHLLFEEAARLIPEDHNVIYTTRNQLRKQMRQIMKSIDQAEEKETVRLLVKGTSQQAIDDSIATLPFRGSLRVWLENNASSPCAIITFLPGLPHEVTVDTLQREIWHKVSMIPGHDHRSIRNVGSCRYEVPGRRSKEGDAGLRCRTRVGDEWPNVMIEVGYSEPLRLLRFDAQWWLLNSGGRTRLVIIALVNQNPNSLHLETWEQVPNPNRRTRNSPPTVPFATNKIDVDSAGTHPSATDITFSTADLAGIATDIFADF